MGLFRKSVDKRCPICGGKQFYSVPVGRAEVWHEQVEKIPHWKQARGLPAGAGVAFSEPRLEWDQPTFERSAVPTPHVRCLTCASLVPPQFLSEISRVLLITTGMPAAGKTTWLKCLFNPSSKKHLIAEPTNLISRQPYDFVEPYTIANPDPRTAVPILLHGMRLTFQRQKIDVAGIDVKGEVFDQRTHSADKYMRVLDIIRNLRSMSFSQLLTMFVVPFDPTLTRQNIGQLTSHLTNHPGSRGTWQGVIWTHLDRARLRDPEALFAFLQGSEEALPLARRVVDGNEEVFDSRFVAAATELERLVQNTRTWTGRLDLLESLTWLLYRIMLAYTLLPPRFGVGKVEFYYSFNGGLGETLVRQCMRLAAVLFSAWDGAGRGDFAAMIREAMRPGSEPQFPVLPCGIEFLPMPDGQTAEAEDGLPVWGDLLLLELLRRHG
ncbi:MAG TPA: hypothetical protein VGF28_23025 [Thermoanaerobaculia bacterium]|jgi:hypothetical protein